ncbi:MAG: hypothetical protein NZO16_07710 [Deltaproteobacteria bacterium]|nr:hypothetical protein [Deltaproteobacteria bacterium]
MANLPGLDISEYFSRQNNIESLTLCFEVVNTALLHTGRDNLQVIRECVEIACQHLEANEDVRRLLIAVVNLKARQLGFLQEGPVSRTAGMDTAAQNVDELVLQVAESSDQTDKFVSIVFNLHKFVLMFPEGTLLESERFLEYLKNQR